MELGYDFVPARVKAGVAASLATGVRERAAQRVAGSAAMPQQKQKQPQQRRNETISGSASDGDGISLSDALFRVLPRRKQRPSAAPITAAATSASAGELPADAGGLAGSDDVVASPDYTRILPARGSSGVRPAGAASNAKPADSPEDGGVPAAEAAVGQAATQAQGPADKAGEGKAAAPPEAGARDASPSRPPGSPRHRPRSLAPPRNGKAKKSEPAQPRAGSEPLDPRLLTYLMKKCETLHALRSFTAEHSASFNHIHLSSLVYRCAMQMRQEVQEEQERAQKRAAKPPRPGRTGPRPPAQQHVAAMKGLRELLVKGLDQLLQPQVLQTAGFREAASALWSLTVAGVRDDAAVAALLTVSAQRLFVRLLKCVTTRSDGLHVGCHYTTIGEQTVVLPGGGITTVISRR